MNPGQFPSLILGLTVAAYWGAVLRMVVRVSRRTRRLGRVLIPAQRREQLMWLVWVPLVVTWIAVPLLAALVLPAHGPPLWIPAAVAQQPALVAVRWLAAGVGVLCLLLSLRCWEHMGRHWRMGVDPDQVAPLFTDGPFASVRHPIYALSILLMLCTVVVVPAWPIIIIAAVHVVLMYGKARNEERFLRIRHGATYEDYCRSTGRFLPRRRPHDRPDSEADSSARVLGPVRFGPLRLNHMQQTMLHWERIHPYVAVHAVRLRGPADAGAFRTAAASVCAEAGLGVLHLGHRRRTLTFHELRDVAVTELPAAASADETLSDVMSAELNRPFPRGPHHPLRWTLLDDADHSGHYAVLAYHHVIADAFSIERLIAAVLRRYRGRPARADEPRLADDAATANAWLRGEIARQGRMRSLRRALRLFRRVHYVHRLKEAKPGTDHTSVLVRTAPAGTLERLRMACRAHSLRISDVFLAALCAAVAEQTRAVGSRQTHEEFALGTILNLRRHATPDVAGHFGVALAESVLLPGDPDRPLPELLAQVARARRQWPPEEQAATLNMCFLLARVMWPLLLKPNHRRTYRKAFPIAAGLSAYFVDDELFEDLAGDVTRYVRASPTGPAIPLVLAPTAFAGQLELALVHRDAERGCGSAADLLERVLARLADLASASREGAPRAAEPARERS